MRKWVPIICLFIIILIVSLSMVINNKKQTKIISIFKNYNITSTTVDNDYLEVEILINKNNSYFIDEKQVTSIKLINSQETDMINLLIQDIINKNEVINYEKESYYRYVFVFKLDLSIESDIIWYFEEAFLNVKYNNDEEFKIKIGSLSLIKLKSIENEYFTITNLKPVTKEINDNIYLTGVIYGIRSINTKSFYINNIEIMNTNVNVGKDVKVIDRVIDHGNFEDYMFFEYESLEKGDGNVNLLISNKEVYYIFVPIHYDKLFIMNSFPVKFTIELNKEKRIVYLNQYKYYSVYNEIIKEENIYKYYVHD